MWMVDILWSELPVIEARETLRMVIAATAPHMEQDDRRRLLDRLERLVGLDEPPTEPPIVTEHNPEKAAAWLKEQGWEIVESA